MIEFKLDKNNKGIVTGKTDYLREKFSVKNEAAFFAKRYGRRFIPSRKYAITPTGRFDVGLFEELFKVAHYELKEKTNVDNNIIEASRPSNFKNLKGFTPGFNYPLSLTLRDYQEEIVKICLERGRGVISLATAGGKTLIMASLLSTIKEYFNKNNKMLKILIVVPDRGLVEQTFSDFTQYKVNFSFSKWTGDDDLNLSTEAVIANIGILQSKNTDYKWAEYVDVLIIDEAHKVRHGNKITKIIDFIKTKNKFGFTGTLPEDNIDKWNVLGKIGPLIYDKRSYELRDKKYIVTSNATIIELSYKTQPPLNFSVNRYRAELEHIFNNSFRNNIILKLCEKADNNMLVLVDFIKHGEIIFNTLTSNLKNKEIYFIRGEVDVSEREKIRKIMENKTNIICVAISKIFSTGINIKNLHYILFSSGGKSKIKVLQSIGRGLRQNINKTNLYIFDIADNLKYSFEHSIKRIKFYEEEKIPYTKVSYQE